MLAAVTSLSTCLWNPNFSLIQRFAWIRASPGTTRSAARKLSHFNKLLVSQRISLRYIYKTFDNRNQEKGISELCRAHNSPPHPKNFYYPILDEIGQNSRAHRIPPPRKSKLFYKCGFGIGLLAFQKCIIIF